MLGPAKINLLRAAPHRSACATNCNEIQQQHPGKRCGSRERSTSGGRIEKTLSLNFNANQGQPSKRFDNALRARSGSSTSSPGIRTPSRHSQPLVLHNFEAGGENGICGLDRAYARRDGPSSLGNSGN